MNSPYRIKPVTKKENNNKNYFEYYLCEKEFYDNGECKGYYCPVCNYFTTSNFKICSPSKKVVVKGHWFWKKYCSIDNFHIHFTCRYCNSNIVAIIKSTEKKPYKMYY